ncbi:MAG: DUF4388 domain-containing protein [Planctomycetes bacterium]|nr:DUF4388 domain-containing protein [Planctomycetota bacterium]
MGFAGNLRTLSLVEVFQTLNRIQATGILRLASPTGGRDLVFDQGAMIGVAFRSGEQKQALLRQLVLRGKLDANAAASLSSTGAESQVVKALVGKGLMSSDDITQAYHHQAEDELASLCTWEYADFVFEDAGPDQPLANGLLERYRKQPLDIGMNHILMEAARRLDDWNRLRALIPNAAVVYSPMPGGEYGIRDMSAEYPASAVAPLIDGVRSVDDVVAESVATRLDVYQVIGEMLDRRLVVGLGDDQLLATADSLALATDHTRAARLYRRLLKDHPDDSGLGEKLAASLEHLGDSVDAAASYAQLALQRLSSGDVERAFADSRRSVELSPNDPALRMTLVRCLLTAKESDAAVAELGVAVQLYLGSGQLEEARATCLKILAIQPQDEDARRQLARIFSQVEKDPAAEDVVVCIQCNHVNDREAVFCPKCRSPLQLSCLTCNRVVGVSDRICIFCGADPHRGVANRQPPGRPSTSTYIKTDRIHTELKQKGSEFWRTKLGALAESAHVHEQAGRFNEALREWRELAQSQNDNAELQIHIRELERREGEAHIERQIEQGHRLRHGRRFWRAANAYRRALRAMPKDDPRVGPLSEILTKTEGNKRRNAAIFACAFLILGVVGLLVAKPFYDLGRFRTRVHAVDAAIAALPSTAADGVLAVDQEIAELEKFASALPRTQSAKARLILAESAGSLRLAKNAAAEEQIRRLGQALDAQDLPAAQAFHQGFLRVFGTEHLPVRLQQQADRLDRLRAEISDRERLLKEGPTLLARAMSADQAGNLGSALADYRALSAATDASLREEAVKGVQRLEPMRSSFLVDVARAQETAAFDLVAGDAAFKALEASAARWSLAERIVEHRRAIAGKLHAATTDYRTLSERSPIADLEAFIAEHPGAPEISPVKLRIATMRKDQNLIQQDIARYRGLMDTKNYEEAWRAARDLIAMHGRTLRADEVAYPLVIETAPAGAAVSLDGREIGKTPFILTCLPQSDGEVAVTLPGWDRVVFRTREAEKRWQLQMPLVRTPLWRAQVVGGVDEIQVIPGGGCIVGAGSTITALGRDGRPQWSRPFPSDDLGEGRPRFHHPPIILPDGTYAVGLPARGFASLDPASGAGGTFDTAAPVRGRPLVYANDIFGAGPRLAFAAEALFSGAIGDVVTRIPLSSPALAGPAAIVKDLDRILAVIDLRGHLIGIEESTKAVVWDLDLQASEAGQLVHLQDLLAVVLDGSRLVVCRIVGGQAQIAWTKRLPTPVTGDLTMVGADLCIAAGDAIHRYGVDGVGREPWPLRSAPTAGLAASGELLAVGCQDRTVRVYRSGAPAWSSPFTAPIQAIACSLDIVFVGLADGTVLALPP